MKTAVTCWFRSVLVVPLPLGDEARGTSTFHSPLSTTFGSDDRAGFELFAGEAAKSLRCALTIAKCQDARRRLLAALESRTVIALASGVIMAKTDAPRRKPSAGTEVRVHFDD